MSLARGERITFDFDTGSIEPLGTQENEAAPPRSSSNFVGDILERAPSTANPPSAPTFKSNAAGFPAHKKRTDRISAFKQRQAVKKDGPGPPITSYPRNDSAVDEERRQIDEENRRRIAEMSPEEIEQEQKELLSALPPSLIEKLLARSNIDDGSNERDLMGDILPPSTDNVKPEREPEQKPRTSKKVTFDTAETQKAASPPPPDTKPTPTVTSNPETPPIDPHSDAPLHPDQLPPSIHFPAPPQPPELDPNSSTFLTDLHEKYFPELPYDPSSVSWMTPIDPSDTQSPYHPAQTALNPSELRFDFKGALLAPSVAREISVTLGLHHHGDAPEAAGYTVPELARLSRSAVATQRCIAYQTLGRILYRLGRGEFGEEEGRQNVEGPVQIAKDPNAEDEGEGDNESVGSFMARGLWDAMDDGRVIETLTEEASREKGHLTARTYAQEALWNWRRGGGRKRRAV
ncbi:RPAP1-like protein [Clohesyomyces aquaticus]|uniref:RPAP1-like protein n=1 Tax=Clohesyomyces aquaticus TaxID=1231657 RepID=A0A1Y1ZP34_9PLEO|nr:RPAP1-like protein [Clohesyomyces aquaticus]